MKVIVKKTYTHQARVNIKVVCFFFSTEILLCNISVIVFWLNEKCNDKFKAKASAVKTHFYA